MSSFACKSESKAQLQDASQFYTYIEIMLEVCGNLNKLRCSSHVQPMSNACMFHLSVFRKAYLYTPTSTSVFASQLMIANIRFTLVSRDYMITAGL